jgi:hypothetical protein
VFALCVLLQQKNCTVELVDDEDYEGEEEFELRLANATTESGLTALLGDIATTTITITNHHDGQYRHANVSCCC